MILIFFAKTWWGGGNRRVDLLSLFIHVNEDMDWVLVESVGKDEHEGRRRQRQSYGYVKIKY